MTGDGKWTWFRVHIAASVRGRRKPYCCEIMNSGTFTSFPPTNSSSTLTF